MPQSDIGTLVPSACAGGGGDRKISCETLATAASTTNPNTQDDSETRPVSESKSVVPQPDFPPESFFLSKEEELDWVTQNAFFERKESQKGNSANSNPNPNPSCQQQTALKAKAFITGLPNPQKMFLEPKNRRQNEKFGQTRLIADLVGSRGRTGTPLSEPSSPKVSCIGRVRSQRSRRIRRVKTTVPDSGVTGKKPGSVNRVGLLSSFRSMFRRRRSASSSEDTHDIRQRLPPDDACSVSLPAGKKAASRRSFELKPVGNAGLGGMKRFASGRRSDLLGGLDVASSAPSNIETRGSHSRAVLES